MKKATTFLFAVLAVSAPAYSQVAESHRVNRIQSEGKDYGYVAVETVWQFVSGDEKVLYVCWENPSEDIRKEMEWVRDSVTHSWQANSKIIFQGWEKCGAETAGIRILVADDPLGPHTKGLGTMLKGKKDGMVLNFTFQKWFPDFDAQTRLEFYIRSIAVHEFGHALSIAHEQNRADAPGECRALRQGPNGDLLLTPYDEESVMNYCNKRYANNGVLSKGDIITVQSMFGK